jgi:hypothetical protein
LRRSLRCFFLDMRLRRFLITEPMLGLLASRRCVGCRGMAQRALRRAQFGRSGYP